MSLQTRLKVESVIREANYRVNIVGRNLQSAQSMAVAFIALDDDVSFLRDPYTAEIVSGFANSVSSEGFNCLVDRIDPTRIEEHSLFSTDTVLGICMSLQGWAGERKTAVERLASLRVPIVLIENRPPEGVLDVCSIRQDDFGGGMMLANHLLDRGAKHILLVRQIVDWTSIEDRDAGISSVFASRPTIRFGRLKIDHLSIVRDVHSKLPMYINNSGMPDAIMSGNDQIAAACINELTRLNLHVPHDVLVTGFNGFEVFDMLPYQLTTVRSPAYELGARSGKELINRLRAGSFRSPELVLSVTMRVGDTT